MRCEHIRGARIVNLRITVIKFDIYQMLASNDRSTSEEKKKKIESLWWEELGGI